MKKIQMLISFLVFLLFTSNQVIAVCSPKAKDIPMYKKKAHLGARTTEPGITASLEKEQLTVNVSSYLGVAKVYAYDGNGTVIVSSSVLINGNGLCSLDLSALECGSYNVIIELGDVVYWGVLEI